MSGKHWSVLGSWGSKKSKVHFMFESNWKNKIPYSFQLRPHMAWQSYARFAALSFFLFVGKSKFLFPVIGVVIWPLYVVFCTGRKRSSYSAVQHHNTTACPLLCPVIWRSTSGKHKDTGYLWIGLDFCIKCCLATATCGCFSSSFIAAMQRKPKSYSSALMDQIPIKYLIRQAQGLQQELGGTAVCESLMCIRMES